MARIGRVDAASDTYGMQLNPLNNALYVGFGTPPPDAQMFTTSAAALPVSVGDIEFGEGSGGGIYTNKVQNEK